MQSILRSFSTFGTGCCRTAALSGCLFLLTALSTNGTIILGTSFVGDNDETGGVFNIKNISAQSIELTGFQLHLRGSGDIRFWTYDGPFQETVENQATWGNPQVEPDYWTLRQEFENVQGGGIGSPTGLLNLTSSVTILPGETMGMAFYLVNPGTNDRFRRTSESGVTVDDVRVSDENLEIYWAHRVTQNFENRSGYSATTRGFDIVVHAVPENASIAVIAGLAGLLWVLRRRRAGTR